MSYQLTFGGSSAVLVRDTGTVAPVQGFVSKETTLSANATALPSTFIIELYDYVESGNSQSLIIPISALNITPQYADVSITDSKLLPISVLSAIPQYGNVSITDSKLLQVAVLSTTAQFGAVSITDSKLLPISVLSTTPQYGNVNITDSKVLPIATLSVASELNTVNFIDPATSTEVDSLAVVVQYGAVSISDSKLLFAATLNITPQFSNVNITDSLLLNVQLLTIIPLYGTVIIPEPEASAAAFIVKFRSPVTLKHSALSTIAPHIIRKRSNHYYITQLNSRIKS